MVVEIMDTTLRDGEQTSGVSFARQEKLSIARLLLEDLKIPRIEIASARVSTGEYEMAKQLCEWAEKRGHIDKIEILGFLDKGASIEWIRSCGAKVMNLLCKGSEKHCTFQLQKTVQEHVEDIKQTIKKAKEVGLKINLYLEDWSNGIQHSPQYVFHLMDALKNEAVERFMLPDTLGILNPLQTLKFCRAMRRRYPDLRFDFHAHNDYDLATANTFAATLTGIQGVHCTVNGLGERAGNAPLTSVVAVLHDHVKATTGITENMVNKVSRIVESYSGIRVAANKPIIGESVFTQCAGVHADGDNKNNLYYNDLLPERFGRKREYALGKTSGRSSLYHFRRIKTRNHSSARQGNKLYFKPFSGIKASSNHCHRSKRKNIRRSVYRRRTIRRIRKSHTEDIQRTTRTNVPVVDKLYSKHTSRRTHRCIGTNRYLMGL